MPPRELPSENDYRESEYLIPLKDTDTQTWTTQTPRTPDSLPTETWVIQAPSWEELRGV